MVNHKLPLKSFKSLFLAEQHMERNYVVFKEIHNKQVFIKLPDLVHSVSMFGEDLACHHQRVTWQV